MYLYTRVLLFLLCLFPVAAPVLAASGYGRFHALVIGNQNYQHLKPLKTPLADAHAVAKVLRNQYGFTIDILLDADREQMLLAISQLRKTITKEEDNLLIYYAGHGYLDELTQVGYWQPVDAEKENDVDWIPTSRVTTLIGGLQAKHILVVADSCYSGSLLTRDSGAKLAFGLDREAWLRRMQEKRSRNALTSGGEEPVMDLGGNGHSIFAKAFLEALRENQEILDGDSLFDRIKNPIADNARQTPQYGVIQMTGHDRGDFLLVPKELQGKKLTDRHQRGVFAKRGDTAQIQPKKNPKPNYDIDTTGSQFLERKDALEKQRSAHAKRIERYQLEKKSEPNYHIDIIDSPFLGRKDAPVTLVIFNDFQSSFKIQPLLDEVLKKNPRNVKIVFKHFPLQMHKMARPAALAAIAAYNQDKFWEMHDALFAVGTELSKENIRQAAKYVGLDMEKFNKDLTSPAVEERLKKDMIDAGKVGVVGAPTLFINGRQVKGRGGADFLQKMIDQELGIR